MSINEKLAELCGMTLVGHLWCSSRNPINLEPEYLLDGIGGNESSYLDYWSPTSDLNQLKRCYEAAEKVQEYELQFRYRFRDHLQDRLHDHMGFDFVDAEIASAMINYPEVFAQAIVDTRQAILKAKGVS